MEVEEYPNTLGICKRVSVCGSKLKALRSIQCCKEPGLPLGMPLQIICLLAASYQQWVSNMANQPLKPPKAFKTKHLPQALHQNQR